MSLKTYCEVCEEEIVDDAKTLEIKSVSPPDYLYFCQKHSRKIADFVNKLKK